MRRDAHPGISAWQVSAPRVFPAATGKGLSMECLPPPGAIAAHVGERSVLSARIPLAPLKGRCSSINGVEREAGHCCLSFGFGHELKRYLSPLYQNTTGWRLKQHMFTCHSSGGWTSEIRCLQIPFLVCLSSWQTDASSCLLTWRREGPPSSLFLVL